MAINFNSGIGPGQNGTNGTRDRDNVTPLGRNTTTPGAPESAQKSEDSVKLSNQVQSLQSLEGKIKDMPEVDQARVDSIKSAIANGEYQIDYERLATAIQNVEKDL